MMAKIIQKSLRQGIDHVTSQEKEYTALNESRDFFAKEFNCEINVVKAEDSKENKAKQSMPGKPAIIVE